MAALDQLAQQISERAGIPADKARAAAQAAIEFLDGRLPAPVGGNLTRLLEGGAAGGLGDLGKMAGGIGGMLGGRK